MVQVQYGALDSNRSGAELSKCSRCSRVEIPTCLVVRDATIWLTQQTNMSFTKTFHGWHHDGAARHGRLHKAVIMVSKSSQGLTHHEDGHTGSSNLRLAPTGAMYEHMCDPAFTNYYGRMAHLSIENTIEWYHAADEISCVVNMDAGDVIIFREDTLHRTQDQLVDRVAFIWDILRFPLPDTPVFDADEGTRFYSYAGRRRLAEQTPSTHGQLLGELGLGRRRSAAELVA